MSRASDFAEQDKLEELKRLLAAKLHDSSESIEDAVDNLLWGEQDQRQRREQADFSRLTRTHPK